MRWSLATIVLAPRGSWAERPSAAERREVLRWAATAGFEGVEVSAHWLDVFAMSPPELRAFRAEVADAGLVVSGLNVDRSILTGTEDAPRNWDRLRRGVEIAAELDAGLVDLALSASLSDGAGRRVYRGTDFSRQEFQLSAERVQRLARRAARHGILLSVELHDDGLLDSAESCLRFLAKVGEPNVGLNPDVGNLCRDPERPGDWEGALRLLAPFTNCWHVKNYQGCMQSPLEAGEIDYELAVGIMLDSGFAGWTSIESRAGQVRATQARGLAYLQALASRRVAPRTPAEGALR